MQDIRFHVLHISNYGLTVFNELPFDIYVPLSRITFFALKTMLALDVVTLPGTIVLVTWLPMQG